MTHDKILAILQMAQYRLDCSEQGFDSLDELVKFFAGIKQTEYQILDAGDGDWVEVEETQFVEAGNYLVQRRITFTDDNHMEGC